MEKVAIQLWKNSNLDAIDFKNFLINEVPRSLKDHISARSHHKNIPNIWKDRPGDGKLVFKIFNF